MPSAEQTEKSPASDDSQAKPAQQKRPSDELSQATVEDFDEEGMGVAPKE
jgi:hypothetical protein